MANDGSIRIGIDLDNRAFKSGLSSLSSIAKTGLNATIGAIGVASTALVGFGTAGVKVGTTFEAAMSQVGATMGMSTEEIRNGSENFKMLEKAAMDAGKSTKFSATESAEALNYMALAGYDAEKSIKALPVVLNLAAAGNLDLAYASDLVTDSMAALGLETSQLEGFTDELAKTSQKSNTSVAQLGEAILTVGGTAKNLAGDTVELNTVLGILADNGIKGSEGGTALRNTILSLASPADQAVDKLSQLGIEVFDASGNMRPLNETFQDLNNSLSTLTQEEKIKAISTIFNNRDLKAVEALLANAGTRFDELSGYIENSEDAASKMAETMNDNLSGSIIILKSSLECLGIEFYKSIDNPAKNSVKVLTDMVGQLTTALETKGLEGFVSAFGDIFASIVLSISNYTPKMIDAATGLIQAFLKGLSKNSKQIAESGVEIGKSLINGIAKIAPEFINIAKTMIIQFSTQIGNAIPILKPFSFAIEFLANNLQYLVIIVGTAVLALKTFAIIKSITAMTTTFTIANELLAVMMANNALQLVAVNGGLTTYQTIVGVLTGKIGLVTAAQGLWSAAMTANPIGIMIMAVAALAAGLAILVIATNQTTDAEKARIDTIAEIKSATEDLTKSIDTNNTAYENSIISIRSSTDASLVQMGYVKDLAAELDSLSDSNGNVDEANRARAAFILGELNQALGTEYTLTGNQIDNYNSMKTSIEELILAEQARIVLKAYEDELTEAIKRESSAKKEAKIASEELLAIQNAQNGIIQDFITNSAKSRGVIYDETEAIEQLQNGFNGMIGKPKELSDQYKELTEKQNENINVIENSGKVIQEAADINAKYSDAMVQKETGNLEAITNGYMVSSEAKKAITTQNGDEMLDLVLKNNSEIERLEAEKNKAVSTAQKLAWQSIIDNVISESATLITEYEKTGKAAVEGLALKLAESGTAVEAAKTMSDRIISAVKAKFDQHSPSKVFQKIGECNMKGLGIGHEKGSKDVLGSLEEITEDIVQIEEESVKKGFENSKKWIETKKKYNELSLTEEYKAWERIQSRYADGTDLRAEADENLFKVKQQILSDIDKLEDDYATAVDSRAKQIFNAYDLFGKIEPKEPVSGKELLDALDTQVDAMEEWSKNIQMLSEKAIDKGLIEELTDMGPQANEQIKALLEMSESDLTKYSNLYQEKSQIAREQAITELEYLKIEAEEKSTELIKGIEHVFNQSPTVGLNMSLGLAEGIKQGGSAVINSVIELAQQAIRAAREELDINSPSKVFQDIGKNVDDGLALGITDNFNKVQDAISNLEDISTVNTVLDIKVQDMFEQGKNAGGNFYDGFISILRNIDLAVNATMASMTPQLAYSGLNNQSSNIITNNNKDIVQNFYSETVSPYQAYKKLVQNAY